MALSSCDTLYTIPVMYCSYEMKPKRSLEATITQLKLRYFGHVMRTNGTLERDIMIGQVDGCRRQGRPRLSIKENTAFGLEKLKEIVKAGNKWRRLVEEKIRNREGTNIKR